MPTYSSALLPNTSGLTFGSAALRWTAYLQDIDIAGAFTASSRVGIKNLEDIRFADQFSGANVTAQIDAALTDISSVGLVVVPSSMGAGNATTVASGKAILDLRSGVPKFFTNNSASSAAWQLNNDGTVTSQGVKSVTANPASAGFIRAAKSDVINFRNNANGADVNGLSLDGSDIVQVGGAAGAKTVGPLVISGALTGVTTISCGQITVVTSLPPFVVGSSAVVANLNVATLNGVTVSGTPSANQVLTASSSSTASWGTGGQYKSESIQYTPVTKNNSAANQTYMSFVLPANELAVGQALRITGVGVYSDSAGGSGWTPILKAGATTLVTAPAIASVGVVANLQWSVEYLLICTAAGSGGTLECQFINFMLDGKSAAVAGNTTTKAFDTTTSNTLNFTMTMDTAAVGITTTQRQMIIERIG